MNSYLNEYHHYGAGEKTLDKKQPKGSALGPSALEKRGGSQQLGPQGRNAHRVRNPSDRIHN